MACSDHQAQRDHQQLPNTPQVSPSHVWNDFGMIFGMFACDGARDGAGDSETLAGIGRHLGVDACSGGVKLTGW